MSLAGLLWQQLRRLDFPPLTEKRHLSPRDNLFFGVPAPFLATIPAKKVKKANTTAVTEASSRFSLADQNERAKAYHAEIHVFNGLYSIP